MTPRTSRLTRAKPAEVIGSHFSGYLRLTYQELIKKLGDPHSRANQGPWRSSDGKTRVEWAFKFGTKRRSAIITIYDYKEKQPIENIALWHVGSKGDMTAVHGFLSRFLSAAMEGESE